MTLADEDTNLILTDNAKRAIQGNVAMQHTQPSGQLCKQCKWRYLVAKYAINVSGAMLLPSSIQVTESISGSVVPLAMFSSDLVVLLFLDTFEHRKCLETGEMT